MKILIYSKTNELIGGIERFIEEQLTSLNSDHSDLNLYFETLSDINPLSFPANVKILTKMEIQNTSFDKVIVHKFTDEVLIKNLSLNNYMIAVVHDHDFYCKRGHKYFPNNKNCNRSFDSLACELCSCFGLKKKASIPFIYFEKTKTKSKLKLLKSLNHFVVISKYMMSNLIENGIDKNRISIIRPFVKNQDLDSLSSRKKEALYVGQLVKGKGILNFLNNSKDFSWSLDIVGNGKDFTQIVELTESKSNVKAHGFKDPINHYKASNFLIFTSTWSEPFGLVGIEAMSFGLPVVAFKVGGVSEWLVHGVNGFLVNEGDYESFSYYCDKLAKDNELSRKMGENAKKHVNKNFNRSNYIDNWMNLLESK